MKEGKHPSFLFLGGKMLGKIYIVAILIISIEIVIENIIRKDKK